MQKWNAGKASSSNKAPSDANGGSGSGDATVDPFILDFGTSVNVNEDLRRAIRAEIQELDDAIVVTTKSNTHEETVKRQLKQDLSHSLAEMQNISRGASEQLESAAVHSNFLSGLEKTLHVNLVKTTGVKPPTNGGIESSEIEKTSPNVGVGNSQKIRKNKDLFKEKAEKLKRITTSLKQTSEKVDSIFHLQKELVNKTHTIRKTIKSEGLEEIFERAKQGAIDRAAEAENESQRKLSMKSATQQIRDRTGSHAQGVADKV